ncbi:nitrate reductase associated protein [Burkholderia sp. L27(2015)]|uniref:nitrate reductase associated protein n=1 Tax=Burkholderia sp. L27(2015) TaxID=1641858 RepID=UPI00131D34BA|nr:nitrate reductase associated protein [Burkholderia sp. L27(2015)]
MPLPDLPLLFDFEIVSSENLTFIPMCVRFNLDRCGLHLTLDQWQALPHADRVALVQMPLALALEGAHEVTHEGASEAARDGSAPEAVVQARAARFAVYLRERVSATSTVPLEAQTEASDLSPSSTSSGAAAWARPGAVPTAVLKQCDLHGTPPLSDAAWSRIDPFQRYILVKLSRRATPNHDFLPALREFCLL